MPSPSEFPCGRKITPCSNPLWLIAMIPDRPESEVKADIEAAGRSLRERLGVDNLETARRSQII
jgi:hypothetical protein